MDKTQEMVIPEEMIAQTVRPTRRSGDERSTAELSMSEWIADQICKARVTDSAVKQTSIELKAVQG